MTSLNGMFTVQNRSGAVLKTMAVESFWSVTGKRYHYDPRILFDRVAARWIIFQADRDDQRNTAGLNLAVSQTSDPGESWIIYRWENTPGEWYDSPVSGLNHTTLSVSFDVAQVGGGNLRTEIFLIDKASLYNGAPTYSTVTAPLGTVLCPATAYDSGVSTTYLIGENYSQNNITLYQASSAGLSTVAIVNGAAPWAEYLTQGAPQLGSSRTISTNDTRVTSVVLRDGNLWFVHTCFLPSNQPTRSSIQWWKISLTGQLLDLGRIDDPVGGTFYAFPSIAVNQHNDAVIGFSQFSPSQYATAAYASRSSLDPAGSFRSIVTLKAGEGPYEAFINRWGDYSATVIDPDDLTFWTVQEYARAPDQGNAQWGTWWGHMPSPASAVPAAPTGVTASAVSGTRVDISWATVLDATSYQIDRKGAGEAFGQIGTSGVNSFSDTAAIADQAYLYRIRAVSDAGLSANSTTDLAATVIFVDSPLTSGTIVKAAHLEQLRTAVNAVRQLAGLPVMTFTDTAPMGTVIKAVHLEELRSAIDGARTALGLSNGSYSDSALSNVTMRAIHVQELRGRVQ